MNQYKKEIIEVYLKYARRLIINKNIVFIELEIYKIASNKTIEEFIECLLEYSKKLFTDENYLVLKEKITSIINRNIKFEIPGVQEILNDISIKKINKDLEIAKDRKILLKDIYEYCTLVEWKNKHISFLAEFLGVSESSIRRWARAYAKENLSAEEYEKINQIINRNNQLELPGMNIILKNKINKITDMIWENEYEKEIILKYMYSYCEEFLYDRNKIEDLADCLGYPESKITTLAQQYAIEYLGVSIGEYKKYKEQLVAKKIKLSQEKNGYTNYEKIFDSLLNTNSLEEILIVIGNKEIKPEQLLSRVYYYVFNNHNGNKDVYEKLTAKIKIYTDYLSIKRKQQAEIKKQKTEEKQTEEEMKKMPMIIELVEKFINNSYCKTISEFCEQIGIKIETFEKYLIILKKHNSALYDLYIEKINHLKRQRYIYTIELIKKLVRYLKEGIETNGVRHSFDIIDYYLMTKISFNDLLKTSKEIISINDLKILINFINQNKNYDKHNPSIIKQIMEEKVIISYQKDNKSNIIPGSEEMFSDEEKQMLIAYLYDNQIPINWKTYNTLYERYRKGLLDLNKNTKKIQI